SYAYLETKQAGIDREAASKAHYWGSGWGVEKTIQAPVNILGAVISIILYAAVTATLHPLLVLVPLRQGVVGIIDPSLYHLRLKRQWAISPHS
ncbi:MAG: hypothetical protein II209_07105, partial [Alistipes sp.]|nr:hypothetical protein [Alistipes sp.]